MWIGLVFCIDPCELANSIFTGQQGSNLALDLLQLDKTRISHRINHLINLLVDDHQRCLGRHHARSRFLRQACLDELADLGRVVEVFHVIELAVQLVKIDQAISI